MPVRQALRAIMQLTRHPLPASAWLAPLQEALSSSRVRRSLARPIWHTSRWVRTAAASASSAGGPQRLEAGTGVEAAIRVACESLGRAPGAVEAALVQRLEENWFSSAADIAAISDADAASLKLPLRLRAQVALLLRSGEGATSGGAAAPGQPSAAHEAHLLSQSAEVLVSEYLSGEAIPSPGSSSAEASSSAAGESSGAGSSSIVGGRGLIDHNLDSIPIEERRCPPIHGASQRFGQAPRLLRRERPEPYALKESEMSEALKQEFAAFHRFCTARFFGQQADPIAPVTAAKYADHMRQFLGYLHRFKGEPLGTLTFVTGLPSAGRDGVRVAFDYLQWLRGERGAGVRYERMALRSLQQAAKFLFHDQSKVRAGSGERPYSDLEVVKELRLLDSAARKAEKVAPRVADEALKWLDWPEYLQLVQELRKECAGKDAAGRPRSPSAVAWSLQRYLLFAILSCVPDRQRTLRELEQGRNLFKEKGRWVIRHGPQDYKTGRTYGERPPLVIAPHIYPELEAFIGKWRAELNPTHNFLFSQQNGAPMTQQSVHKLFSTTAFRLTGKKCNPHLVRDSIVTYLRGAGASERELEALAIYMGHSVEMQRETYDRRTKQQKVEPAVELLASLNTSVLGSRSGGSSSNGSARS